MWRHLSVLLVLVAVALPSGSFAQNDAAGGASTAREIGWAAANGIVTGIAAGVWKRLHGGDFWEGFSRGAIGGLVHYGGKRLSAVDSDLARVVARQVGGLGTSLIADAASSDSAVLRFRLLLGPAHFSVDTRGGFTWAVNLRDIALIVFATAHPDLTLLWRETLVHGAPIFRAHDGFLRGRRRTGMALGGVVLVEPNAAYEMQRFLTHEMVHVLQNDLLGHLVASPLESKLLRAITGASQEGLRHVEPGILLPAGTWLLHVLAPDQTLLGPFEGEAEFIEARVRMNVRTIDPRLF